MKPPLVIPTAAGAQATATEESAVLSSSNGTDRQSHRARERVVPNTGALQPAETRAPPFRMRKNTYSDAFFRV